MSLFLHGIGMLLFAWSGTWLISCGIGALAEGEWPVTKHLFGLYKIGISVFTVAVILLKEF